VWQHHSDQLNVFSIRKCDAFNRIYVELLYSILSRSVEHFKPSSAKLLNPISQSFIDFVVLLVQYFNSSFVNHRSPRQFAHLLVDPKNL
jgi:hypothetical protein